MGQGVKRDGRSGETSETGLEGSGQEAACSRQGALTIAECGFGKQHGAEGMEHPITYYLHQGYTLCLF